jgi:hypothetical protein
MSSDRCKPELQGALQLLVCGITIAANEAIAFWCRYGRRQAQQAFMRNPISRPAECLRHALFLARRFGIGLEIRFIVERSRQHGDQLFERREVAVDGGLMTASMRWLRGMKAGLMVEFPDYLKNIHKQVAADLPQFNGEDSWTLPIPAQYVIGRDAVIAYAEIDRDHTHRPETSELLPVHDRPKAVAQAGSHVEGSATVRPSPKNERATYAISRRNNERTFETIVPDPRSAS